MRPSAGTERKGEEMVVGRVLGWLLVLAAILAFGAEVVFLVKTGAYTMLTVGKIWAGIDANSLVGFGAFVEKSISPALWSDVLVPLFSLPAWAVAGVPGAALVWFCRKGKARRRRKAIFTRTPRP